MKKNGSGKGVLSFLRGWANIGKNRATKELNEKQNT